jgi:hypothetical protein
MKKIMGFLWVFPVIFFCGTVNAAPMSSMLNNINMMYFDFGIGMGTATGWNQNSLALNAMTMGAYMNDNLGVEVGMDTLPNGGNSAGEAMIMSYHLAAKGILPLSTAFSLYGKAGFGVNAYEGESPSPDMNMDNQSSAGLYYAAGVKYNMNTHFALYLEGSGIAVPIIGNNGNTELGSFGSTYQGTLGLELSF